MDDSEPPNPVAKTFDVITGKWKPLIIFHLKHSKKRFTELFDIIPGISKRMLTKHLRELEEDQLIVRLVYAEVPTRVEYHLSDHGLTLLPLLDKIVEWGINYLVTVKNVDPDEIKPPNTD